jgi:RNA polymerase sigma factor (TIGR02999 family)
LPVGLDLPAGDITILLDRWTRGDSEAVSDLTPLVYSHLRKVATSYLRRERPDHTLEVTGLVNELFLVLLEERRAKFEDRVHFFTFAARIMRRILVDYARTRQTAKRGAGEASVELSPDLAWVNPESDEMLDLDRALDEMEAIEPRKARVVELRIFLGCTSAESAELMGISKPTLDRDLRFALAWLFNRMKGPA